MSVRESCTERDVIYELNNDQASYSVVGVSDSIDYANIQSHIDGLPVTTIGEEAFAGTDLVGIALPETITTIGDRAFAECELLKDFNIPQYVETIGADVFQDSEIDADKANPLYVDNHFIRSASQYAIDENIENMSMEEIEGYRYSDGIDLEEEKNILAIDDDTISISSNAIDEDLNVVAVYLNDELQHISPNAFNGNTHIKAIEGGQNIETIGAGAFKGCHSLEEFRIPPKVKVLEDELFSETNLHHIDIGPNIEEIGKDVFTTCPLLTDINVDKNNKNFSSKDGVLFDKKQETLIKCNGKRDKEYHIPDTVKTIKSNAFTFDSVEKVFVPDSVKSVEPNAFKGLKPVTKIIVTEEFKNHFSPEDFAKMGIKGDQLITYADLEKGEGELTASEKEILERVHNPLEEKEDANKDLGSDYGYRLGYDPNLSENDILNMEDLMLIGDFENYEQSQYEEEFGGHDYIDMNPHKRDNDLDYSEDYIENDLDDYDDRY